MPRLFWYLNRFRVMSIKEIITMRIYRFLRNRMVESSLKIPKNLSLDFRPFESEQREFYLTHFSYLKKELIQETGLIMGNKIKLFGKRISFPNNIDWNKDFITEKKWPLDRIDYHSSEVGDPRDVWELNRHQFLPILGKAFYITQDEHYAQKAISLINSWIKQNSPYYGINWVSAFELALRIISWIWTLKFIASSESLTQMAYKKICKSLFRQASHILKNLSLYSSANNHLIAELTAVAFVGIYLKQDRWKKKAFTLLEEEIGHQLLPDGAGTEQSPYYLAHVMEYYLLISLVLKEREYVIPEKIRKGLARAAIFLQSVLDQDGYPFQIGDNDSGEVMRLSSNYSNSKSLLNLVAFVTEEYGVLREDLGQDEKTFWLIGPEKFQRLSQKVDKKVVRHAFPEGGYYILERTYNGTQIKLIFDCGPLGMRPMAGHGHADALSFILIVDGLPVFIDPGTFTYFKSDFWRNYFRGTSAHNTIRIDGKDQSKFIGKFLALSHAKAKCTSWNEGTEVSGSHDGYVHYKSPAVHNRTISFDDKNSVLRIFDIIETQDSHLLEQFFHLDKHSILKEIGDKKFEIETSTKTLNIRMDRSLEVTVYYGDEVIPFGWQSVSFGYKEKIFTLVGRRRITSKTILTTEIYF